MKTIKAEGVTDCFSIDLLACFRDWSHDKSFLYKRQLLFSFICTEADNEASTMASLTLEEAAKSKKEAHFRGQQLKFDRQMSKSQNRIFFSFPDFGFPRF